jgi:hypothetical protein
MRKAVFAKASSAPDAPQARSIGTTKDTKTTKDRGTTYDRTAGRDVFVSFVVESDGSA